MMNPMAGHMGFDNTRSGIDPLLLSGHSGVRAPLVCVLPGVSIGKPPGNSEGAFASSAVNGGFTFNRIGTDPIGPFHRRARGDRFVLVLVDYATRYPEAVPLRNIYAKCVTQALFQVISRVGIPERDSDGPGTQFMSRTLRGLYGFLGIKSIRTSVSHPQADGLVERLQLETNKGLIKQADVDTYGTFKYVFIRYNALRG